MQPGKFKDAGRFVGSLDCIHRWQSVRKGWEEAARESMLKLCSRVRRMGDAGA